MLLTCWVLWAWLFCARDHTYKRCQLCSLVHQPLPYPWWSQRKVHQRIIRFFSFFKLLLRLVKRSYIDRASSVPHLAATKRIRTSSCGSCMCMRVCVCAPWPIGWTQVNALRFLRGRREQEKVRHVGIETWRSGGEELSDGSLVHPLLHKWKGRYILELVFVNVGAPGGDGGGLLLRRSGLTDPRSPDVSSGGTRSWRHELCVHACVCVCVLCFSFPKKALLLL